MLQTIWKSILDWLERVLLDWFVHTAFWGLVMGLIMAAWELALGAPHWVYPPAVVLSVGVVFVIAATYRRAAQAIFDALPFSLSNRRKVHRLSMLILEGEMLRAELLEREIREGAPPFRERTLGWIHNVPAVVAKELGESAMILMADNQSRSRSTAQSDLPGLLQINLDWLRSERDRIRSKYI